MEGETYWPPHNIEAGSLVRKEVNADKTWPKYRVYVKRYHEEYIKTRNNVRGITKYYDSNYETEKELGKGKRRKKINKWSSSDSEEEKPVKKSTKPVAAPPNVQPPNSSDFYKAVPSCSYINENQKKKLNIKVNSHKSQKIQKQETPLNPPDVKEKTKLVQKVLDARKRATEKSTKLPLQSLSSNKNIDTTNSLKKLLEHQVELVHIHTKSSKCNKQTLPDENKKNNHERQQAEKTKKNYNEPEETEKIPQLSNKDKNSDFDYSMDTAYSTEDSSANVAIREPMLNIHVDISSDAASNLTHTELQQLSRTNIDESQTSSVTSSEKNKMQDMRLQLIKLDKKVEEINCKLNTVIMNQGRLNKSLLPQEKKRLKPHNMLSLPLTSKSDVEAMEKWLQHNENNVALVRISTDSL